jgi:hypothetical protein
MAGNTAKNKYDHFCNRRCKEWKKQLRTKNGAFTFSKPGVCSNRKKMGVVILMNELNVTKTTVAANGYPLKQKKK